MKRITLLALGLFGFATTIQAVPGGKLKTLQLGDWTCEVPGDATVMPIAKPELSFVTVPDSSYTSPDGTRGSYLRLTGEVTLTSGPFSGRRFVMDGEEIMREIGAGGKDSGIRCVHASPINIATPG